MPALKNTLANGANGTAVTSANSGGANGDAISVVVLGAGASAQYLTPLPWGGSGAVINNGTAVSYFRWDDDSATETRRLARFPIWLEAAPLANASLALSYVAGSASHGGVQVKTNRKLQLVNSAFVAIAGSESTATLEVEHLYWCELAVTSGAGSTGALEYRLYDSDGTTVLETKTITGIATQSTPPIRVRLGANTSAALPRSYFKDIRWEAAASGWLGPLSASPPTLVVTSTPRQVVDVRGSSVPTGSIDYAIAQVSGPATTPEALAGGVWAITPHATETLEFEVTASGSLGGSDAETITVPPAGSGGSSGPSSPYRRLRKQSGGTWS